MDAIVYRKPNAELAPPTAPTSEQPEKAAMSAAAPEAQVLSAAHFYPRISEPEMTTWTHWLPTAHVFPRNRMGVLAEITHMLSRLKAPAEVVEEFSATLRAYGVSTVIGDRYGGEWPREACRTYGIRYEPAEQTK